MHSLLNLALFDIRYQLRQPAIWLYVVLLLGQGLWLGMASNDPTSPYILLAGLGPMVMLVASVLAGQALTKDLEYKTAAYLYAVPVPDSAWFIGKLVGTYLVVLGLTLFYPAGLALAAYLHGTPVPIGELSDAFLKIVVQNVLFVVSVGYALTVFTRRMAGAYLAMFVLGLYALLTQSYRDVVANDDLLKLLDPFGIGIVTEAIEQAGGTTPDLSETWTISRLLWLGLTFGLVNRAKTQFSFEWFAARPAGKSDKLNPTPYVNVAVLPVPVLSFSWSSQLQTLRYLSWLTFRELTSQVTFRLTLLALVLATIGYALFYGQPDYLAQSLLPTTARMTALRQPLGLFIGLFLLVWTGELAFRERTTGIWMIYDTLPQPTYLTALAKLFAMMGLAVLLTLTLFGVGVGLQLTNAKTPIEWSLYANDLLIDGLFRYWQLIALALFVSTVTSNRLLTHALSASVLVFISFAPQLPWFSNPLWRYSFLPGSDLYSDLTGYGRLIAVRLAFHGLWWGVASILLLVTIRNWPRGVLQPGAERLASWIKSPSRPYVVGLLFSIGWVVACGYIISHNGYATDPVFSNAAPSIRSGAYQTRLEKYKGTDGRSIPIRVTFHHPYNADLFLAAVQAGMSYGERIFGPYPYARLQLTEIPASQTTGRIKPGQISLGEPFGWLADRGTLNDIDYIYYVMVREVLKQWLPNKLTLADAPGRLFLQEGLVDYLSCQALRQRYGQARLTSQLTSFTATYARGHSQHIAPELPILKTNASYVGKDRAAVVLTSIGQVWGDDKLTGRIGQFYRSAVQARQPVNAATFGAYLDQALPDSLRYLTTYLRNRIFCDVKVGQVSQLPNGLFIQIIGKKWEEVGTADQQREIQMADYIPIVLLDATGRECYRTLVLIGSEKPFKPFRLPLVPGATDVVIDPLGAWSDNKADNHKRLARDR